MSALSDAIERSFTAGEPDRPAVSPLSALGRRQLSGVEVLAQSVATTAPAASMVLLPVALLQSGGLLAGVLTILGATVLILLVAYAVSQFTRRQAAAGGLYSFVFQGLGTRAALTGGVAIIVKYLGSATLTLHSGAQAVITVLAQCGVDASGAGGRIAVYAAVAVVTLGVLTRGARVAALAILAVEVCSLLFVVGLMAVPGPVVPVAPTGGAGGLLLLALMTVFALAGFESATFFGPEARRPLVTVTRVVLVTPLICGALFVGAAWAAWTGHAGTLVAIYLHGTSSGASAALVIALNVGLACSWLASAAASSHAASRVVYSMGVERLLPRWTATVHRRFRTPHLALAAVVGLVAVAGVALTLAGPALATVRDDVRPVVRGMVLAAYVLVAVASVRFLGRIGERTRPVAVAGVVAGAAGAVLLAQLVIDLLLDGRFAVAAVVAGLLAVGSGWQWWLHRRRPDALARVGAFDHAESADVLPGAGVFAPDTHGNPVLVRRDP